MAVEHVFAQEQSDTQYNSDDPGDVGAELGSTRASVPRCSAGAAKPDVDMKRTLDQCAAYLGVCADGR